MTSTSRTRFWDEESETLARPALEALQLARLKKTVAQAYRSAPFYREQLDARRVRPRDVRSLRDLGSLPFTTRDDLRATYPYGLLAVPRERALRLHTSSGTTGKPKAIFFSARDVDTAAGLAARCLVMTGATAEDVFQNMMTYGLFTGALVMHYGAEKVGILVIPAGSGSTDRQLLLMEDFGTTLVHLTASFALYLADVLEKRGIDPPRDFPCARSTSAPSLIPRRRAARSRRRSASSCTTPMASPR